MFNHKLIRQVFLFVTVLCILAMGFIPAAVRGEDEADVLKITVGEPTLLSPLVFQNSASVAVSRTGAIAAFLSKAAHRA